MDDQIVDFLFVSLLTSIILLPTYGVLSPVVLTTFSLPLALSMFSTLDFVPPIVMEMHGNLSLNCSNNEGFLSVVKVVKSQEDIFNNASSPKKYTIESCTYLL